MCTQFPEVVIPMYVKFVSPARGFGLFAAADFSVSTELQSNQCVGTYGGIICDERDPVCKHAIYALLAGSLPDGTEVIDAKTTIKLQYVVFISFYPSQSDVGLTSTGSGCAEAMDHLQTPAATLMWP